MSAEILPFARSSRTGKIILMAVFLLYIAVVIRTIANPYIRSRISIYLFLESLFLILFTLTLWHPVQRTIWQHSYFVFQSLLVLFLLSLRSKFDFIVVLFLLLSFQTALIFPNRVRWMWVGILTLLICIPLVISLGILQGLALALMPMVISIIFPAYMTIKQEIETGIIRNQAILNELRVKNQQLSESASQVDELSAIQERDRLARELHDSVSQMVFSINLHTRASQILLERDPNRLRSELELMQSITQSALAEMRDLIAHMRPMEGESVV